MGIVVVFMERACLKVESNRRSVWQAYVTRVLRALLREVVRFARPRCGECSPVESWFTDRVWLVAAVGLLHERHIPRGVLRIGILLDGFSLCPPDVEAVRADRGSADGHPVTVVTTFPIIGPMTTTMLPRYRSCSPTFPVTRMINRPRGPPRSTGP